MSYIRPPTVSQRCVIKQRYDLSCITQRRDVVANTAWFLLTRETLHALAIMVKGLRVVEVAAGTGYLASHVRRLNTVVQYDAFDLYPNLDCNYGVEERSIDDIDYSQYDVVIMTWPPYDDPLAFDVCQFMLPGQTLIYNGEWWGGCTGNSEFFSYLDSTFTEDKDASALLNENHIKWSFINDLWGVYQKI